MEERQPLPILAVRILMADDDPDDRFLLKEAFEESRLGNLIDFKVDGQDLIDYLKRQGPYTELKNTPLPGLILLDLNMPRKDGREALEEIRSDSGLRHIPVVVLTTSDNEDDVQHSYDLGVNSFIVKPATFEGLVHMVKIVTEYWLQIVRLPTA